MNKKTPKTDKNTGYYKPLGEWKLAEGQSCVQADFARSLEVDNQKLKETVIKQNLEINRLLDICQSTHDRLLRGQDDKTLLDMLEESWSGNHKNMQFGCMADLKTNKEN